MTTDPTPAGLAQRAQAWAAADPDPATRAEIESFLAAGEPARLADLLRGRLEFGTAGMRGVLGAGPNRMNRAMARRVGAALGRVLLARVEGAAERGVAVAHDMRRLSPEMALEVCGALTGAGLRVHLIEGMQPTPLLAFATLELRCAAGVMVTASHNPPQYNGIKVYWENGVQIVPPIDAEISAALDAIDSSDAHGSSDAPDAIDAPDPSDAAGNRLPTLDPDEARRQGRLVTVPAHQIAARYLDAIAAQLPPAPATGHAPPQTAAGAPPPAGGTAARQGAPLGIVYTPLHGVALPLARAAFARRGLAPFAAVAAQAEPDGAFPTVELPNPEEPGALDLALQQAAAAGADLVLANDPDGDRLAAAARNEHGALQVLTGDEIGCLLAAHLLDVHAAAGTLPAAAFVVTTVVSSSQLGRLAGLRGVHCEVTLTGLKWIWHRALELERRGGSFLFGYEEALGYSVCPAVRDKDGISAAVLLAEMAQAAAASGATLFDRLADLQTATGVVATRPFSLPLAPAAGQARVRHLARHPPLSLGGQPIIELLDYQAGERRNLETGAVTALDLPPTPLIVLVTAGGGQARLRPSGTEPKLKVYLEAAEAPVPRAAADATRQRDDVYPARQRDDLYAARQRADLDAARRRAVATLDDLERDLRQLLTAEGEG